MPPLLGYALANNCLSTPLTDAARQVLHQLQTAGQLAPTARVALGSQLCLAEAHRGQGLMPALLAQLHHQLAPRFDYLYASVHRLNARSLAFHLREGYQLVLAETERLHLLHPIQPEAPVTALPAGLVPRPGRPADAPALHALNGQWLRVVRGSELAQGFLTTHYAVAEYETLCVAGEVAVLEL